MTPARWEGPARPRRTTGAALAYHQAGAPWPTCSCVDCRRARRAEDRLGTSGPFAEAVERMRDREAGDE